MTTPSGNERDIQLLTLFFEWVYDVTLEESGRTAIANAVRDAVEQPDDSGRELVEYVLEIAGQAGARRNAELEQAKDQVRQIFRRAFSRNESNERARILAAVHRAIEERRPGATGVSAMMTPSPFREMPVPPPMSPSPTPGGGLGSHGSKARQSARAAELDQMRAEIEQTTHNINMGIIRNMR